MAPRLLQSPINEETIETYTRYSELLEQASNPETASRIIRDEVCSVFRNGETHNRIVLGLRRYLAVIRSRVEQLMSVNPEPLKRENGTFKSSPRTRIKLLQELCSRPVMRQNFARNDLAQHGEEWCVDQCIIDPDLIDDHLLECLGLDEFMPKNVEACFPPSRKSIPRQDQIAVRAEAVPSVKDMFATGLEPLLLQDEELQLDDNVRYFRFFRITKGKNRGKILGTYNTPDHKKDVFLVDDINSAYRRVDHILQGYDEEIRILQTIDRNIRPVRDRYNKDWKSVKENKELPALTAKITSIADTLSPHVKNEHKKNIRRQVAECLTVLDSRGRVNPNAKAARLSTVLDRIGRRISEISGISQHLAGDRVHLGRYLEEERGLVVEFCDKVEDGAKRHDGNLAVLDTEHEIEDKYRARILANLREAKRTFERFKFQPYLALSADMIRDLDIVIDSVENRKENPEDRVARQQAFLRVYAIAKMIKLEHMVVMSRDRFFKPGRNLEDLNPGSLFGEIKKLQAYFSPKKRAVRKDVKVRPVTGADVVIPNSYPLYVAIHAKIRELLQLARRACSRELRTADKAEERVKLLLEIDRRLKVFSISKLMEDMPPAIPETGIARNIEGYRNDQFAKAAFKELNDLFTPVYQDPWFDHAAQLEAVLEKASELIDSMIEPLGILEGDDALRRKFVSDVTMCGDHARKIVTGKFGIRK